MIFLDSASTTPTAPEAVEAMLAYLGGEGCYYNPSSSHALGRAAGNAVQGFRQRMADLLGCDPGEVIFTSGGTESNNWVLRSLVHRGFGSKKHVVTSLAEHKSILETCRFLEKEGVEVTYLKPCSDGLISLNELEYALRPDTVLVSLAHVNSETGVIQPIEEMSELLEKKGILFHVDAAQSAGKLPIDLSEISIDFLSLSAHKFYGPKGIGCLVVRKPKRFKLQPMLTGGGQEFGFRSGTLATHQIAGMATAFQLAVESQQQDYVHVKQLKDEFINSLQQGVAVSLHGNQKYCSPYIVNFSITGVDSDALINHLDNEVAISSGSACSSGSIEPSHVLRSMGFQDDELYGAVRVSFNRYHLQDDIAKAALHIAVAAKRIYQLSKIA